MKLLCSLSDYRDSSAARDVHSLRPVPTYELHSIVKITKAQNRNTLTQKRISLLEGPHLSIMYTSYNNSSNFD
jgi:hypothetical protein